MEAGAGQHCSPQVSLWVHTKLPSAEDPWRQLLSPPHCRVRPAPREGKLQEALRGGQRVSAEDSPSRCPGCLGTTVRLSHEGIMKMTWTHEERREKSSQRDEDDGTGRGDPRGPGPVAMVSTERRGVRRELAAPGGPALLAGARHRGQQGRGKSPTSTAHRARGLVARAKTAHQGQQQGQEAHEHQPPRTVTGEPASTHIPRPHGDTATQATSSDARQTPSDRKGTQSETSHRDVSRAAPHIRKLSHTREQQWGLLGAPS